jgi:hypothetical protein
MNERRSSWVALPLPFFLPSFLPSVSGWFFFLLTSSSNLGGLDSSLTHSLCLSSSIHLRL